MFNENSQMPERPQGYDESAQDDSEQPNEQPSASTTDRFGLQAAGKGYLTRKYNITTSSAGNPYFTPIGSALKALVANAEEILVLARKAQSGDDDRQANASLQAEKGTEYFLAVAEAAGEGREWLARKRVIWPLTDDLGYQLYKAASGLDELADFGAWLVRTDANIQSISDAMDDERYQKRQFWAELALAEAGEIDAIIMAIDDSTEYNLDFMLSAGYRSAANLDTRNHLRGVHENVPVDPESDVKAQLKAQLLAG